jgi:hypothetical protein
MEQKMNFVFERIPTLDHGENFIDCPDYASPGIKRFSTCPFSSMMMRYARINEPFNNFDISKIKWSTNPDDFDTYIISSGVNHHPLDWCGTDNFGVGYNDRHPDRKNLFEYINPRYLKDLQSGKAFLLLDQCHEGYQTPWLWEWFHNNCNEYKINPEQIMYITGSMIVREHYDNWFSGTAYKNKLFVAPYPKFESIICSSVITKRVIVPRAIDHINYKTANLGEIKTYNALQKRPRAHRMWLFNELLKNNLLEDGINSMNTLIHNHTYYEGKVMDISEWENAMKHLPMLPPHVANTSEEIAIFENQDSGRYQLTFNEQIMLDSFVSVISEASHGDQEGTCFISEKTFKPIACNHPFIIFGNKGSLAALRSLGYKTFHPYIDETYDTLNTWDRLDAVVKALESIYKMSPDEKLQWFNNLKPILDHNFKMLVSSNDRAPITTLMIDQYLKEN